MATPRGGTNNDWSTDHDVDRSHVGYSYGCDGYDPMGRVNGHVFIEYVSASRPG